MESGGQMAGKRGNTGDPSRKDRAIGALAASVKDGRPQYSQVSKALGIGRGTLHKWWKKYQEVGNVSAVDIAVTRAREEVRRQTAMEAGSRDWFNLQVTKLAERVDDTLWGEWTKTYVNRRGEEVTVPMDPHDRARTCRILMECLKEYQAFLPADDASTEPVLSSDEAQEFLSRMPPELLEQALLMARAQMPAEAK